jgi:hypothetical protein
VTRESTFNVVLFVVVVAKTRALGFFIGLISFAATIPVEVGSECGGGEEDFDTGVIVTSQSFV